MMKQLITTILSFTMLTMMSCGASQNVSTVASNDQVPNSEVFSLISSGQLQPRGGYTSSGSVELFFDSDTNTYSLLLSNFVSSNGPDVHVYLSVDSRASDFTDLGDLKSTSGTIRYDFPESQYSPDQIRVLIWCRAIDEAFGEAELR